MSRHEGEREFRVRAEVAGGCRGRTLELGFGVGSNWQFLPPDVDYIGIEPDFYMRTRASAHPHPAIRGFELRDGDAQAIDVGDFSVDTVLATLVFCTIPDAGAALREARRVLKADGQLRFWEHVRPAGRTGGVFTDAITPPWSFLGGGCHPNRQTLQAIRDAGFEVTELQRMKIGPLPAIVGVARPAEAAPANQGE